MRETASELSASLLNANTGKSAGKKRKRGSGGSQNSKDKVTATTLENGATVMTSPEALGKRELISLSMLPPAERHTKFAFTDTFSRLVSEIYQVCESTSHLLPGTYKLTIPLTALSPAHYNANVMHRTTAGKQQQVTMSVKTTEHNGTNESSPPNNNQEKLSPVPVVPIVNSDGWVVVAENVTFGENGREVTIVSNSPGLWMVVCTVKEEYFTLPPAGVLFSSKLSRFVSGRFPKGAIHSSQKERRYRHRMIPMSPDLLPKFQADMLQLGDLVVLSDVYEFEEMPSPSNNNGNSPSPDYNRAATIRLPLPELPAKLPERDCVWRIFHRPGPLKGSGWLVFDSQSKQVTRTSLAFDTRRLGSYMIAYTLSNLNPYLGQAVTFLWQQSFILHQWECAACGRACDGVFWLCFNLVRNEKHREDWYARKAPKGYKPLRTTVVVKDDEETESEASSKVVLPGGRSRAPLSRRYAKSGAVDTANSFSIDPLAIKIAQFVRLTVEGEIRWAENGKRPDYLIQAQPFLSDHDVEFRIEPEHAGDNFRSIYGTLKAALVSNDDGGCEYRELASFAVDITRDQVKEWWEILHPPPPPPIIPAPAREMDAFDRLMANNPLSDAPLSKVARPQNAPVSAAPRQITAAFVRLTAQLPASRRRTDFTKEAKVLSGRSLHCLASELRDGLVLALNLGLPDSMVTGIGFDALSEGLSLIEVTYRILLLWKRRTTRAKDQVTQLIEAIAFLGRQDMADMLEDHAQQNAEITPACIAEYRGGGGGTNDDNNNNNNKQQQKNNVENAVIDVDPNSPRSFKTIIPLAPPSLQQNSQSRHIVSGTCQAKKLIAEAKLNKQEQSTGQQEKMQITEPTKPLPPAVEYRVIANPTAPKLIGVENGPNSNKLQGSSNNPYLTKLAPIIANQESANFVAKNKPNLVKKSKNNIENALHQEDAPDRPSTPSSDVADDISQISL